MDRLTRRNHTVCTYLGWAPRANEFWLQGGWISRNVDWEAGEWGWSVTVSLSSCLLPLYNVRICSTWDSNNDKISIPLVYTKFAYSLSPQNGRECDANFDEIHSPRNAKRGQCVSFLSLPLSLSQSLSVAVMNYEMSNVTIWTAGCSADPFTIQKFPQSAALERNTTFASTHITPSIYVPEIRRIFTQRFTARKYISAEVNPTLKR